MFIGRTDIEAETPITLATWCEEVTHLKRPWCWGRLRAGEGDDRGWDRWMASLTWWTWVCVNSGSGWWTGRPGVLRFMGSQRVGHDWATELNWTEVKVVGNVFWVLCRGPSWFTVSCFFQRLRKGILKSSVLVDLSVSLCSSVSFIRVFWNSAIRNILMNWHLNHYEI